MQFVILAGTGDYPSSLEVLDICILRWLDALLVSRFYGLARKRRGSLDMDVQDLAVRYIVHHEVLLARVAYYGEAKSSKNTYRKACTLDPMALSKLWWVCIP